MSYRRPHRRTRPLAPPPQEPGPGAMLLGALLFLAIIVFSIIGGFNQGACWEKAKRSSDWPHNRAQCYEGHHWTRDNAIR